jgi:hypothetical protein
MAELGILNRGSTSLRSEHHVVQTLPCLGETPATLILGQLNNILPKTFNRIGSYIVIYTRYKGLILLFR